MYACTFTSHTGVALGLDGPEKSTAWNGQCLRSIQLNRTACHTWHGTVKPKIQEYQHHLHETDSPDHADPGPRMTSLVSDHVAACHRPGRRHRARLGPNNWSKAKPASSRYGPGLTIRSRTESARGPSHTRLNHIPDSSLSLPCYYCTARLGSTTEFTTSTTMLGPILHGHATHEMASSGPTVPNRPE